MVGDICKSSSLLDDAIFFMDCGKRGWICDFDSGGSKGRASDALELGNKGANLAEMSNIGIDVPPGFIISSGVMNAYYAFGSIPIEAETRIQKALLRLGDKLGRSFGDVSKPLIVSVRSGSSVSMPGMMDTILNLGLNDDVVAAQNNRYLYDSYRRLIQMYSSVVLGVDGYLFEDALDSIKRVNGLTLDSELRIEHLQALIERYKMLLNDYDLRFPQDVQEQFHQALIAVFRSWSNPRAITYRRINNIPDDIGTAVNIQSMVFGNINDRSASGVLFTRNPSTGAKEVYGEYLINSQGEDIVAGVRNPDDIRHMESTLPEAYESLLRNAELLERHYKGMQDIEFTVEDGKLWILQTRNGKRAPVAAIRIMVDLVQEGLLDKREAVAQVSASDLTNILHSTVQFTKDTKVIAQGLPASPGAETGVVVFSVEAAFRKAHEGFKVILVRNETSPEDIAGMQVARGFVTVRGGMTSHAAVVARSMGKACVCGVKDMVISSEEGGYLSVGGFNVRFGEEVTIDGSTGSIMIGETKVIRSFSDHFRILMEWIRSFESVRVNANADTPQDAKIASEFGAGGIGLCRTEHMFFAGHRINLVRQMILAKDKREVLDKLGSVQKHDFIEIFEVMLGKVVIIRLLDPPLHEFLPKEEAPIMECAESLGISAAELMQVVGKLREENPMLGHRGCRLGISHPEIYQMQLRAIFEAATSVKAANKVDCVPWIMVPFIMGAKELLIVRRMLEAIAADFDIPYKIGAMIEIPSAAMNADEIAAACDFISFGTNDLTQTVLGLSRDDVHSFIDLYKKHDLFSDDPFVVLDQKSVGALMRRAIELARSVKPDISIGICGEHGGCFETLSFLHDLGLDYVSCSPYRIPMARLASAKCSLAR